MRIMLTLGAVLMTAGIAHAAGQDIVAAVPEPGTLALLATGISGVAGAAWWIRRK